MPASDARFYLSSRRSKCSCGARPARLNAAKSAAVPAPALQPATRPPSPNPAHDPVAPTTPTQMPVASVTGQGPSFMRTLAATRRVLPPAPAAATVAPGNGASRLRNGRTLSFRVHGPGTRGPHGRVKLFYKKHAGILFYKKHLGIAG